MPVRLRRSVTRIAQDIRTDRASIFLTARLAVLYRYTREADLIVGVSRDGRSAVGMEDSIGPFEDLLVLRNETSR